MVIYDQVWIGELGVKSINLGYTQTSSFTMSRHSVADTESQILNQVQDDEVHTINDVWFKSKIQQKAA